MKKYILPVIQSAFILLALSLVNTANCQSDKDKDLMEDAVAAKTDFIHTDSLMSNLLDSALWLCYFSQHR